MYSIQLQTTELGEPEHGMHTCPHPASNICQTLNCHFSKLSFVHKLVLRNIIGNDKLFQQAFFARKMLNTKV